NAGTYAVDILYACPSEDVGAQFEVRLGESRLAGQVMRAHDPVARGQENDRAPRGTESLVKDFVPMRVGDITLAAGPGQLVLQATKIPGRQVMEVRGLWLHRK
ncbi:MAG: N-acetylgalactosamine 6-sulfate sulfatase, partial [Pirellulaceae bacterium]|nr:N-acetylgalactosamine 6-sulfate sulfatase [Pirellulaceae bacterium]